MKTKDEIISIVEATVAAYSNSPVWYKSDIEKYMEQYSANQNEALIIENKLLKDRLWRMSNSAEDWMNKYKEECKRA